MKMTRCIKPARTGTDWAHPMPHLHRDWANPAHICPGTGLTPATFAPGLGSPPELGSPRPHLRRDWARPAHICAATALTASTSALGLGSPLPHLRRDRGLARCRLPSARSLLREVEGLQTQVALMAEVTSAGLAPVIHAIGVQASCACTRTRA